MRFYLFVTLVAFFSEACRETHDGHAPSLLDGQWATECLVQDEGSRRIRLIFGDGHTVHREDSLFALQDCEGLEGTIVHDGSYQILVTDSPELFDIDMTMKAPLLTPVDSEAAAMWNQENYCGQSTWTAGISKNLEDHLNTQCLSFGAASFTYRDKIFLQADQLIFGRTLNGSLPRPELVDDSDRARVYHAISAP